VSNRTSRWLELDGLAPHHPFETVPDTSGELVEQRAGNVLTPGEHVLERDHELLEVPMHAHSGPGIGHFAQRVEDEEVVADLTGDQRQQISGANLPVLAAEPLGPALDTGRTQRRRDPGDASSDPPRPNG